MNMQTVFYCDHAGEAVVLQTFHASFGQEHAARLSALVAKDGKPWFRGTEAAAALGYKNPGKVIRVHVDEEDKGLLDNFRGSDMDPLPNGDEGAAV